MKRLCQQPVLPLSTYDPNKLWRLALAELRQQMTKATFTAWLVDSCILTTSSTPAFWVVVVRNEYAWEWIMYRLSPALSARLWDW